jgi:glutamate dehydrogenase (NAD(P)+)
VAQEYADVRLDEATVVIQGFGAVGGKVAHFLSERGAVILAVADSRGAIHDRHGLDITALLELKQAGKSVIDYTVGKRIAREDVVGIGCDIWIPAARPDVIRGDNVDRLDAKLVIEGANIPVTREAERILHERGVLCVPDFIANAGGVICAAMEYQGATELAALQSIEDKLRHNTRLVLEDSRRRGILPRQAAEELALALVRKAMDLRRFSLFSTGPRWI